MSVNDDGAAPQSPPAHEPADGPARAGRGDAADLEVACRVSDRSLRFVRGPQYDVLAQDDLLRIDVMTVDRDGRAYKLCELTVGRADLLRGIAAAGEPPQLDRRAGAARNVPRP